MAPSPGQLPKLLGQSVQFLKYSWQKASAVVQGRVAPVSRPVQAALQPELARVGPSRPTNAREFLRQQLQNQKRLFSATTQRLDHAAGQSRHFSSSHGGRVSKGYYSRSSIPKTRLGAAAKGFSGRTPFASTLRPNLTGGAIGRTAGGYSIGGGARYFSHTPAAPAEVISNVSQGIRALFLSGKRVHYDGTDAHTGQKKWKCVTVEEEAVRKATSLPRATPGSWVDFAINPTITAFSRPNSPTMGPFPSSPKETTSLASEGLMDALTADFSRSIKDLAAVLEDLKRLSSLGDLPISYLSSSIRVHFPGCDAATVEKLCDDLGVGCGTIHQDADFDLYVGTEIALLFPMQPSRTVSELSMYKAPPSMQPQHHQAIIDWQNMMSPIPPSSSVSDLGSNLTDTGAEFVDVAAPPAETASFARSPSGHGFESVRSSELEYDEWGYPRADAHTPLEYQGIQGIYRFLEQCEASSH